MADYTGCSNRKDCELVLEILLYIFFSMYIDNLIFTHYFLAIERLITTSCNSLKHLVFNKKKILLRFLEKLFLLSKLKILTFSFGHPTENIS